MGQLDLVFPWLRPVPSIASMLERPRCPSVVPEILFLVEQIRSRAPQIDDLGATVSVLLQPRTLKAVERIGDTFSTAHDAFVLVVAEGAFIADADEGGWSYVAIADGAFTVAFVAKTADGYARLLAAHH